MKDLTLQTRTLVRAINKRRLPTPSFNGKGYVLQFIEKFQQVAGFNNWPDDKAFFRLKNALTGSAALGLKDCTGCGEIYECLQARFKLSEMSASQLLKALEWRASEDA